MSEVEPKREFQSLNKDAVRAALADPASQISVEVARLVKSYTASFWRYVAEAGYMRAELLHFEPSWPIEAIARRLARAAIQERTFRCAVTPKPEFQSLGKDAVLEALADPKSRIAVEVGRLFRRHTANYQKHFDRFGYLPTDLEHLKPRWPIEGIAMRLAMDATQKSTCRQAHSETMSWLANKRK